MDSEKTLLYLARHGETPLNGEDRFRGPLDVPLDDTGKRQALELRDFFKDKTHGQVVHSDMQRTRATAAAITPVHTEGRPELQALNVGDFAGQPKSSLNLKKLRGYLDKPSQKVPGGESLSEFRARVQPAIKDLVAQGATSAPPVAIVHSSVIHEAGHMFNGDHQSALVKPGGVTAIVYDHKTGKVSAKAVHRPVDLGEYHS